MRWKQQKTLAIAGMIGLMLCSSFFSGVHQVDVLADRVNQVFTIGEYGDGLSIQRDLDTRVTCVQNILQIAKLYIPLSDADMKKAEQLALQLQDESDRGRQYACHTELQAVMDGIFARLDDIDVSEKNRTSMNEQRSIFNNAANTISYDPYNSKVEAFEKQTEGPLGALFRIFASEVAYFR